MQYQSTRNQKNQVSSLLAIIQGLANDGGLYVPSAFPKELFDDSLLSYSYQELAYEILHAFFEEYPKDELRACVKNAYTNKFSSEEVTPLVSFEDGYLLELYHGPTCAFKDVALSILPHLLTTAYRLNENTDTIAILTATSGDTGKAALEGFKDVEHTLIQVFYPSEGVSSIQKRQMQTSLGKNVSVVAIQGNFDDCQRVVKRAYQSEVVKKALHGVELSSANSINIGRLIPQVVYYFDAYLKLVKNKTISFGDEINFVVPTGNFGNILAGYYAKQLGLPIHHLICASNENNVLTDFIHTGHYSRNRNFFETMSPSMDILVSSNLERLLYHLSSSDEVVKNLYQEFEKTGEFTIGGEMNQKLQDDFVAYWASEKDCAKTISKMFHEQGKLIDPHTAVAVHALWAYQKEYGTKIPCVALSTASAYKFSKSVLECLEQEVPNDDLAAMQALSAYTNTTIPHSLETALSLPIRFDQVILEEDADQTIVSFIEGGSHD